MEDDETFTLTIMDGSLPDDVARGTYGQARITIVDDDSEYRIAQLNLMLICQYQ